MALNKTLFSLESLQSPSENELCLTYNLPAAGGIRQRITVTLLFVPNTRRLADARVDGLGSDVGDMVGAHVQANDVSGLLASLLARARAENREQK